MASNASNAEALAAHREAFSLALDEYYNKLDESHVHIKTKHEYEELVSFLKGPGPRDKNTKKTKRQYYAMENYVVMNGDASTGERDYLISKTVYEKARDRFGCIDIMKIKRLATKDDLFDIIREHHLKVNHAAKKNTWASVKDCYSNISRDVCGLFVSLCHCKVNQRLPGRPEGIKPILSKTFNDRGQMDLIDMQSNIYDGYTWILHYQDHLTKFCYLRALKNKKVSAT
jgi:hypothetical protein